MKTLVACLWLIVSSSTCNLQDPTYFKLIQHTIEDLHFCDGDHHEDNSHHYPHNKKNFAEIPQQPFIAPKTESIPPCCAHGGGASCSLRDEDDDEDDSKEEEEDDNKEDASSF